jgi:Putative DNA-binding domain
MLSLHELQADLMHAILDRDLERASRWVAPSGPSAVARIGIYANNSRVGFIESLRAAFPVVERLVGTDYFRQCGRDYHRRFPSTCGDLQLVGAAFPQYLGELHGDDQYRYLADVARLEWAYQDALIAADNEPFDLELLREVTPERCGDIKFGLGAGVRLIRSEFPILRIWLANQADAASEQIIALDAGADSVLVHRFALEVKVRRLPDGEYSFLDALGQSQKFGAAVAAAELADPDFDATASLQTLVAAQVITHFDPEILS